MILIKIKVSYLCFLLYSIFSYFPIYHSLKFVWHDLFMVHSNDVHFSDDIEDLGK